MAPNRRRRGAANNSPAAVMTTPVRTSMENAVFMTSEALLRSPLPRAIEQSGAPPSPNRFVKAVTMMMIGKQSPTPPSAEVPSPGILPM